MFTGDKHNNVVSSVLLSELFSKILFIFTVVYVV